MSAKRDDPPVIIRPKSVLGRWIRRFFYTLMFVCVVLILGSGATYLRLKSGPLTLPGAQASVERLAKEALSDFEVRVGGVSLVAAQKGFGAKVELSNLQIFTKTGQNIANFPIARAKINPVQFALKGVQLETIEIVGAEFRVLRDKDGRYNILPPGDKNMEIINPKLIFAAANAAAKKPSIKNLRLIDMIDTRIVYIDRVKSRVWRTSKANIKSIREVDTISAFADVTMRTKDRANSSVGLRFSYGLGGNFFNFGFKFKDAPTVDIADQVPALDWLRSFDALVTGSLNTEVKVDGTLDKLSGVLETEEGELFDSPDAKPIKFTNVKTYFEYAKKTDSLTFQQITANSAVGSLDAEAVVSLFRDKSGAVNEVSGSLNLLKLQVFPDGIFAQPLIFDKGNANLHLTLSPLSVTLKDASLSNGRQEFTMVGSSVAGSQYWDNSYFVRFNQINHEDLLKFWPLKAVPKTRKWISENLLAGFAKNGLGQLRMRNGKASVDLKFDIENAKVRYLKTLPILQEAYGRGHLTEKMFKADLGSGYVIAPNNSRIDVSGSTFHVPDLTKKPAIGEVALKARGSLQGALSILDEKPFEYLKKTNLKPTLAEGEVAADVTLVVPLKKKTKPKDVRFEAIADIKNVTSTQLIKNHTVTADKVILFANDSKVELSGGVKINGVAAQTSWLMPIGEAYNKRSELTVDVILNKANLNEFGADIKNVRITGGTPAQIKVALEPKKSPTYRLSSDMVGLGLNIRSLDWSKPKKSKGNLLVAGDFKDDFTIKDLRINAAGLSAKGAVRFNKNNSFKRIDFSKLSVGNWLNAAVSIEPTSLNLSKIIVRSGTVDLRKVSFSKGAKRGTQMDVVLDRLILADGIILTNVRAELQKQQGLQGPYSARINGGAQITGTIFPQKHGTAVEINAKNAGAVLRSTNLYSKGVGGDLRLILVPLSKEGQYHGTFRIKGARIKQDNVLADILNGISVVGLVQQLAGNGIVFDVIDGQFTLKPSGVEVRKTSAVGVSMGISLDGNYNSKTKNIYFEGVITPLYALNGTLERVFGKLFGRARGEGLFSFVYKVTGSSENPKTKVNPLSILAPGVFREIFRTEMPNIGKATTSPDQGAAFPEQKGAGSPKNESNDTGTDFSAEPDR